MTINRIKVKKNIAIHNCDQLLYYETKNINRIA